jgi:hypothetical protein
VVVSLVHTSLGSSYLIADVLHYPPPPQAHSFVIGTAVISNNINNNSFVLGPAVINTHNTHTQYTVPQSHPPHTHENSFIIGTAVINTHPPECIRFVRAPSRAPVLLLLPLSHNIPLPRVH